MKVVTKLFFCFLFIMFNTSDTFDLENGRHKIKRRNVRKYKQPREYIQIKDSNKDYTKIPKLTFRRGTPKRHVCTHVRIARRNKQRNYN